MLKSFATVLFLAITLSFIYPSFEAPILVRRLINTTSAGISSIPYWKSNALQEVMQRNTPENPLDGVFKQRPSPPPATEPSRGWEPIYKPQEPIARNMANDDGVNIENFRKRPAPPKADAPSRGWEPIYKPAQEPVARDDRASEGPQIDAFKHRPSEPKPTPPSRGWAPEYKLGPPKEKFPDM